MSSQCEQLRPDLNNVFPKTDALAGMTGEGLAALFNIPLSSRQSTLDIARNSSLNGQSRNHWRNPCPM